MTKQMLSICLAFVLLLGTLAGCSKNKTKTDNSSQNTQQETIPELASQYAYQPQYFDLPEPIQWISRSCVSGSTLYFTASILSGQDTYIDEDGNEVSYDTYSEGLFRFDPDSGECVQIVNYVDKPDVEDLDDGTQIFRSSNSSSNSRSSRKRATASRAGSRICSAVTDFDRTTRPLNTKVLRGFFMPVKKLTAL